MRVIASVLVVTAITMLCACRQEPAQTAAAAEQRKGASVSETDDPVQVISRAQQAMLGSATPYRCQFEDSADSEPDRSEKITLEIADRDHYRVLTEVQSGTEPSQSAETIYDGNDVYTRARESSWRKLSRDKAPWLQPVFPPLPLMSGLREPLGESGAKLKFDGPQELDGASVFRYVMTDSTPSPSGKTLHYWIGARDGLPHKVEVVQQNGDSGAAKMTSICSFGDTILIRPPI